MTEEKLPRTGKGHIVIAVDIVYEGSEIVGFVVKKGSVQVVTANEQKDQALPS